MQKREAFPVKKEEVEETFAKLAPKAKAEVKKPKVSGPSNLYPRPYILEAVWRGC